MLERLDPVSQLLQVLSATAAQVEDIMLREEMNITLSLHSAAARFLVSNS
jgi:hypothetical protein